MRWYSTWTPFLVKSSSKKEEKASPTYKRVLGLHPLLPFDTADDRVPATQCQLCSVPATRACAPQPNQIARAWNDIYGCLKLLRVSQRREGAVSVARPIRARHLPNAELYPILVGGLYRHF